MKSNSMLYSSLTEWEQNKTWAEIDLSALRHNFRLLRTPVELQDPSTRVIAVVKAEAYGHGTDACIPVLLDEGCDFFAVSCIDEAAAVEKACRAHGKEADILILGYTDPALARMLAEHRFIQSLLSPDYAAQLANEAEQAGVTVRAHVAVDTGMNRIGYSARNKEQIEPTAQQILALSDRPQLRIEGMFTHFSRADEIADPDAVAHTEAQSARYRMLRTCLEAHGMRIPFHHACNSIAAVLRPTDHFDGVRFGILLYGAGPIRESGLPLRPVMKLCTVVSHIHTVEQGEPIGYGGTFRANSARCIATLPIGYADGFLRAYQGAGVTVETADGPKEATVVGSVCMDQCMIDVTDLGARVGDVVTVFGGDTDALSRLAEHAGTIPYECLALLSPRVKLHYRDDPENSERGRA